MRGWAELPSTTEIRRWAEVLGLPVGRTGKLPLGLIARWNREHPERPFIPNERFHGTGTGYTKYACRCQACSYWSIRHSRDQRAAQVEDRKWQDGGVLDLDPGGV